MTQPCPDSQALLRWIDRESLEGEAIARHVATCATCTARADVLGRVIGDLRAPTHPTSPEAVRRLMRRLDEPRPRRVPVWTWMAGAVVALATCVLVLRGGAIAPDAGFHARGGTGDALERWVGTTVYALQPPSALTALAAEADVHADTAFTLGYRNLVRDRAMWLLVFAVDAAGEVHWLYPGYAAVADDPEAMRLAITEGETLMSESVTLDRPASGRLRVVSLISPEPLRISAIEGLAPGELTLAALQERFPAAAISELPLQVVP